MTQTITEALAEVKTINKRIEKKQQFVMDALLRQDFMKDPLEAKGGAVKVVAEEMQGISDLRHRIIAIRTSIQQVNEKTNVTIGDETHSVAEWLIWRREVAPGIGSFLGQLRAKLNQARNMAQSKGVSVRGTVNTAPVENMNDIIINVDEYALAAEAEKLESILGQLDGKLSLVNATTFVD